MTDYEATIQEKTTPFIYLKLIKHNKDVYIQNKYVIKFILYRAVTEILTSFILFW